MTSEPAAQQRSGSWGARQTVITVGVSAVIAGLGGAAIYAATEGSSHTMGRPPHVASSSGVPFDAAVQPVPPNVLHSEYVVPDGTAAAATPPD